MNVKAARPRVAPRIDPVRPRVGTACPRWRPSRKQPSMRLVV
jgi:hypothetical protein